MSNLRFDPLTTDWWTVWHYRRAIADERGCNAWDDDCDCGRSPKGRHHPLCSVSPIYAELFGTLGDPRLVTDLVATRLWAYSDEVAAIGARALLETLS